MSELKTPKSWWQAENKRGRGIFENISHFSDGHLLNKLLSPDSWDNPHKDSWQVSETKTNKRCRAAISHPWLEADCGPVLLFPCTGFCIFYCESALLDSFLSGQLSWTLGNLHLFPVHCLSESSFSLSWVHTAFFSGGWEPCMANLSYFWQACFSHLPLM